MQNDSQSPSDADDRLAELVYRLVRKYLAVKAADKGPVRIFVSAAKGMLFAG